MSRVFCCFLAGCALTAFLSTCGGDDKCRMDSQCPPGRYCEYTTGECIFDCAVNAECPHGKVCDLRGRCVDGCTTDDGCPGGQWCEEGQCVDCNDDLHCGADCWNCTQRDSNRVCVTGFCGCLQPNDCAPGEACVASHCEMGCEPACAGRDCGPDGCGGSCGECGPEQTCEADGACHCEHLVCGQDCCQADQVCTAEGCCTPDCSGVTCGLDPVCGAVMCGDCQPWGCNLETSECMTNQVVAMTGPDEPEGIASGSEAALADTAPWKAFDHSDSPYVTGNGAMPPYFLTYEFTDPAGPRPVAAYAIQFETAHGALNMAPRNWWFQGYDGQNWTTLDTQEDQVGWSESEIRVYGLNPTAEYGCYQIRVSVTNGNTDTAIGELFLLH